MPSKLLPHSLTAPPIHSDNPVSQINPQLILTRYRQSGNICYLPKNIMHARPNCLFSPNSTIFETHCN